MPEGPPFDSPLLRIESLNQQAATGVVSDFERQARGRDWMHKYEIVICWSNEDEACVAQVPNCRPAWSMATPTNPLPQTLTKQFSCGLILLENLAIRFP